MKLKTIALLFSLLFVFSCATKTTDMVQEEEQTRVSGLKIEKQENGEYGLNLYADNPVDYRVLYSKEPYKLVIFLNNAVLDQEVLTYSYSDELIKNIVLIPGKESNRVEVLLTENVKYSHRSVEDTVSVSFMPVKPEVEILGEVNKNVRDIKTEAVNLASKITGFQNMSTGSSLNLNINLDGIARYDYGYLDDGTLYIDLFDVTSKISKNYPSKGVVKDISVNQYYPPQKVRLLVDVYNKVPVFAGFSGTTLTVSSSMTDIPNQQKYIASVDSVSYNNVQSVIVKFIGRVSYTKKIVNESLHIEFDENVKLLGNVQSQFMFNKKPFLSVELLSIDGKPVLVLIPDGDIFARIDETPEGMLISASYEDFSKADLEFSKMDSDVAEEVKESKDKAKTAAEDTVDADKLVNLNLVDMDIKQAIRLLFFGRDVNLIFGEEVQGNVTLYLNNVDYRTALNLILRDKNLTMVPEENIIWIISQERYEQRKQADLKRRQEKRELADLEPAKTVILPVNFSTADDLKGIVSSVLTKRGTLEVDARTNSFVITDTQNAINSAKELLKSVDRQTPQVTIEARIVEVVDSSSVNLGIQWGGTWNHNDPGTHFPSTLNLTGGAAASGASGNNYMVNLPVGSPAGALALTLGNRTGSFALDLALSALETQNKAKTISSPRITTLDNMEATIKSGSKALIVPSGDNTETQEIDIGIILKVKPHITANEMVFLDITVEKSTLGEITATTATSEEKKAVTKVLLANGETTVIGGLYEDEMNYTNSAVPGLSDLPLIGWMFKNKQDRVTKRELLVFLTPYVEN